MPNGIPWYKYIITQAFGVPGVEGGHSGIDFGVPDNTPLFFPTGGKVVDTSWYQGGGRVAIQLPGTNIIEYLLHLTSITVKPGDVVKPDQVVGYSGGGVGDTTLQNGQLVKATSQSQFGIFSNGYHTHFGIADGGVAGYWKSLGNNVDRIDPTSFINTLRTRGESAANTIIGASGGGLGVATLDYTNSSTSSNPLDINTQIDSWFTDRFNQYIAPVITNTILIFIFLTIAVVLLFFGVSLLTGDMPIDSTAAKQDVLQRLGGSK